MSIIRFVHAADLHLDSPFKGMADVQPEIATRLRDATFDAYQNIIDLCISEGVDALLIAGDVFDGADHSLRAQREFVDGLRRLDEANIRSFICHGNHDPLDGWEAKIPFPSSAVRFGADVEKAPVFLDDPDRAVVYGVSYPVRDVTDNLVLQFRAAGHERASIGLIHANVGSNANHANYAPCTLEDLERTKYDYWALGHVHTRDVMREQSPAVVYPGNPQGRHPNETGARGVYLVDIADSGEVSLDFRAVDTVRWESLEISIADLENDQELVDAVDQAVEDARNAADGRDLVIRLTLSGRGPTHASLVREGFVDDIRSQLNDTWSGRRPFTYCERVSNATSPTVDRNERLKADDFVGDLLRLVDSFEDEPQLLETLYSELEPLYGNSRASRYLGDVKPTPDELVAILKSAEDICMDMLLEGE
ncbi:MAG: DNA repair exonuclease [Chloroflexi bacterium]|nr:DNA repair exonuclease [Chloroflexota bacterium]